MWEEEAEVIGKKYGYKKHEFGCCRCGGELHNHRYCKKHVNQIRTKRKKKAK